MTCMFRTTVMCVRVLVLFLSLCFSSSCRHLQRAQTISHMLERKGMVMVTRPYGRILCCCPCARGCERARPRCRRKVPVLTQGACWCKVPVLVPCKVPALVPAQGAGAGAGASPPARDASDGRWLECRRFHGAGAGADACACACAGACAGAGAGAPARVLALTAVT